MKFNRAIILFVLLFLALIGCSLFVAFPVWFFYGLIGLFLLVVAVGSFSMSLNFFLKSFTGSKREKKKIVALTFDDGPHPVYTPKVLELLNTYNAKAIFFCIGKNVEKYPKLVAQIAANGHIVGNHSFSHKNTIDFSSTKNWISEIERTDAAIEKILKQKPTFFRPPYGVTTPHLAKAIEHTRHTVLGWNVRPFDTSPVRTRGAIVKHIKRSIKPGSLILLHDTHQHIAYVLEHTLIYLQETGYKTVSVNNLLHEK
ncbi:MAG: polysaccharide deacetylase [Flavobacteriaceae bacterium]|nr:polysaccharide deacetylase [Flavobacteriaceae bacterium]